jgi:hypothetical protein
MAIDKRHRDLWETTHRIQDMAETLEEMSEGCRFSTSLVLRRAAADLRSEVRYIREGLAESGHGAMGAAVPRRLL